MQHGTLSLVTLNRIGRITEYLRRDQNYLYIESITEIKLDKASRNVAQRRNERKPVMRLIFMRVSRESDQVSNRATEDRRRFKPRKRHRLDKYAWRAEADRLAGPLRVEISRSASYY